MRKYFAITFFFLATHFCVSAQTNKAAIDAILNTMPAQTNEQLNKNMDAISALGETGITEMVAMLKPYGQGDNTSLEYAIGGYTYYVVQPGKEAQRATAVKAYCAALDKLTGVPNKQFIIKQLQQMGNDGAVSTLKKYLGNEQLGGAAARALKQINTPGAKAALVGDDKDTKVVMFTPANTTMHVQTKTAELYETVKARGRAGLPVLQKAMQNNNIQYRQAALWYAAKFQSPETDKQWLALLPGLSGPAQVQVIDFIGSTKDATILPQLVNLLKDKNKEVRIAAIGAAGKVGNQSALPALLNVMKTGDADEITAIKNAILIMKGDGVVSSVTAALPGMPSAGKAALLEVLAARSASQSADAVLAQLQSNDNTVHTAAAMALPAIVSQQTLTTLFDNGDVLTKKGIIATLSKSTDIKVARMLLHIAQQSKESYSQDALNGYIAVIHQSHFPNDEKLLMLKEAMALAGNDAQRKAIIDEAGDCSTFLSLIFAGKYLDDASVQQEAAHAVMDIALSHKEFNGEIVRTLLTKAMPLLAGKEADADKKTIQKYLETMPAGEGFVSMFNGNDLAGWKGLVENPVARAKMPADTLAAKQADADKVMRSGWVVKDGLLIFTGHGENLCTVKQYSDFDMYVDWKILKDGDAGIYLRGSPQVQIWDTSRVSVGAQVGSGGLYNNQKFQSKPLVLADNAIAEWNSFHIIMRGDKVTVYLNGVLVTDNITLENYWDRAIPIFPKEQIELQAHGNEVFYRDLYIKELTGADPVALSSQEKKDGFTTLFDGSNLDQWTGDKTGYKIDRDGAILVDTLAANPGNMYTKQEYSNFTLRFEFQLTPGANNGIGIRAPLEGDAAYVGMEIQVLDNEADMYKDLHPYQYHGSVYGVIPAKRGFLKPTGEWNYEEITAQGPHIKVTLNGEVILDGNIDDASKNGTVDHKEHPGLKRQTGHIGFLGHGAVVKFKNVRIKTLTP